MDRHISKAKDEALSRKEILEKVEKWMAACEEENWLEDYNRVRQNTCFVLFLNSEKAFEGHPPKTDFF